MTDLSVGKATNFDRRLDTKTVRGRIRRGAMRSIRSQHGRPITELDDDGHRWYSFDSIIGHKRGEGGSGKTEGWLAEVL
jgi:hypothetical protein